jgi:hypothetical protein
MCGHSRIAGAVTHTGPIGNFCSATLRPDVPSPVSSVLLGQREDVRKSNFFSALTQFTKRRMRTFITIPSARNVNITDEPP